LGERRHAALGGGLVGVGLLAIGLAPWLPLALAGGVALGLGFYAFHNTLQVHGTQLSTRQRGMGMALFALSLFLGQSLGVALAAQVVGRFGFTPAFVGAALGFGLLALGFVAALARQATAARPG
jgi:YNFM family putative membrane transporter